jgi:hypothetical protein
LTPFEETSSNHCELLESLRCCLLWYPKSHEYERLRLSILFRFRYRIVRFALLIGSFALPQVTRLGQMATSLAVQMEEAMARLGERAAFGGETGLAVGSLGTARNAAPEATF